VDKDATKIDDTWREHRSYVLSVAFRMLGNIGDAEDVVQEAFTRLLRADQAQINDVRGWLVVVVSRLCLDHLGTARVRREAQMPNESAVFAQPDSSPDPADRVTLDDNVRIALLVVLQELTPAERTVFVLHDVFQYPFEDVAQIVGRSVSACRQLASRARRHVEASAEDESRFRVEPVEQRLIMEKFVVACAGGSLEALMRLLDPDVEGIADLGPDVGTSPIQKGRDRVAHNLLRFFGTPSITMVPHPIDGHPAVLAFHERRLIAVISLEMRNGLIAEIHAHADPEPWLSVFSHRDA
jgi:RNA polymerase sigma-70 factor (ECF subfamily)